MQSIRPQIDLPKVRSLLRDLADWNDYERRLLAMGLKGLNDGAEMLPTCASTLLDENRALE